MFDEEILRVERLQKRLYSEMEFKADEMRDYAQSLERVLETLRVLREIDKAN